MSRTKGAKARHQPPERYRLGTEEELGRRDGNTFKNPPTSFQQISPADSSRNLNEPGEVRRDSFMKFTSHP